MSEGGYRLALRDIIVVGCSVGGVEALQKVVGGLPAGFPGSLFVVLHIAPETYSVLPNILSRAGKLPARHAVDGELIRQGRIYVAPPDHHLVLEDGRMRLTRGAKENRHRPAIDPLFRSAARWYGPRVIGVILTGALDDGTAGLMSIKKHGGLAIVQDPEEAFCPSMPHSAVENVEVDHMACLSRIPELLEKAVQQPVSMGNGAGENPDLAKEVQYAELEMAAIEDENRPGTPSQFACPECGGVLWEIHETDMLRFRCRVGHAYTASNLDVEQTQAVENALWAALRALEEGASLAKRMAKSAGDRQKPRLAKRFAERAQTKMEQAGLLRKLLVEGQELALEDKTG
jgi:two-component system, chemotaxis family, protein-glutamate methylesterase/glutaminase